MGKRNQLIWMVVLSVVMMLTFGCGKSSQENKLVPVEVASVTVQEIKAAKMTAVYETSGTVKARTVSVVAAKVMGTVTAVLVKSGDRVQAGQVLATLEDRESYQKVIGAEAGYREAMKGREVAARNQELQAITYERYRQLHDGAAISQHQLDQVHTQSQVADLERERAEESVKRAMAALEEARVYQGYSRLLAPLTGVVTEKKLEVGSMLLPGMPAITVEDTDGFSLEAYVEETLAGKLPVGLPVTIEVAALSREFSATIEEVVPSVSAASRSFLVKFRLPQAEGIRTGLYGTVKIPSGEKIGVYVPQAAVVTKGQLTGVYVLDDAKRLSYRLVRLGQKQASAVEVVSGLNDGERVVVAGVENAVDGGVVREVRGL